MLLGAFKSADSRAFAMGIGGPVVPNDGFTSELRSGYISKGGNDGKGKRRQRADGKGVFTGLGIPKDLQGLCSDSIGCPTGYFRTQKRMTSSRQRPVYLEGVVYP